MAGLQAANLAAVTQCDVIRIQLNRFNQRTLRPRQYKSRNVYVTVL
jgi:hypothetical protein